MRRSVARLCVVAEQESPLTKSIWKASVRSVRVESVWDTFSKQVVAQAPFLTPREVATIVHSFARVKYRDDRTLTAITPSILKHLDAFSVREIVHIMSAFRKLEYAKLDCIDLLINQLVLKFSEWNEVDCALIANAVGWFRIFDESLWKHIGKFSMKHEFEPLGLSLILGAMAKLDRRHEPVLRRFARQLLEVPPSSGAVFKQESFAILVHAFYKLGWTKNYRLNMFFEDQARLLLGHEKFFDFQSLTLVLHAMFGYRVREIGSELTESQSELLDRGLEAVIEATADHKMSLDQYRRLRTLVKISTNWCDLSDTTRDRIAEVKRILKKQTFPDKRGHKLPRWEYEVYRILKDKMQVPVVKRVRDGRTDIFVKPHGGGEEVCVLCLGPFQYYAGSTKRTTSSILNQHLVGKRSLEIPYFVWNELKTDQDKVAFLYTLGRRLARADPAAESEVESEEIEFTHDQDDESMQKIILTETDKSQLIAALDNS